MFNFLFRPLMDRRKPIEIAPVRKDGIERRKLTSKQATHALECSIDRFAETVTMSGEKVKELLRKAGLE